MAAVSRTVHVCSDADHLARTAATAVIGIIRDAIRQRGSCHVVLAGGSTPRRLYEKLADQQQGTIDWPRVHLYPGDERFVDAGSADRNEHMARATLIDRVAGAPPILHGMPAADVDGLSPARAAEAYETTLRETLATPAESAEATPTGPETGTETGTGTRTARADDVPRFDVTLLGLGEDGHTASLFPGDAALAEERRWVTSVERSPTPPHVPRLTLTLSAINSSRAVIFLVAGANKRDVLRAILHDAPAAANYPASLVRPTSGTLDWFIDADAAP